MAAAAGGLLVGWVAGMGTWLHFLPLFSLSSLSIHICMAPLPLSTLLPPASTATGPGELPRGAERIAGLTWHPVATSEAAEALLREGDRNRYSAITGAGVAMPHPPTSRSHVVVSVRVRVAAVAVPSGSRVRSSCGIGGGSAGWERGSSFGVLHLVDLAGEDLH